MLLETNRATALANLRKADRGDAVALGTWALALASELGGASRVEASAGSRWIDPEVQIDFHDATHATDSAKSLGLGSGRTRLGESTLFTGRVDGVTVSIWGVVSAGAA